MANIPRKPRPRRRPPIIGKRPPDKPNPTYIKPTPQYMRAVPRYVIDDMNESPTWVGYGAVRALKSLWAWLKRL